MGRFRPRVVALAVSRAQRADLTLPAHASRVRHTAVSLAVSSVANVKAVQTMLGHASAVLTLETYSDLSGTISMPAQRTLTRPSVDKVWDFCECWTGEAPSKIMDRAPDLRKQGGRSGFRTPDLFGVNEALSH